jgi:hypothetical protein
MTTKMLDVKTVTLIARSMWMNETKDMTLFVIQKWTLTTIESGGVTMTIVLKRKIMNEMMTTFLPSVLLMLTTYATTFFKPYFFEAALSVNLTTMLVMTTIFMTVMQMLPATAYVKMIDIFLIFGQLYPFTEVVLLTMMEYKREGDGSGETHEETPAHAVEDKDTVPEDPLYWYRFTGERINMHNFFITFIWFQRRKCCPELCCVFVLDIQPFLWSFIWMRTTRKTEEKPCSVSVTLLCHN